MTKTAMTHAEKMQAKLAELPLPSKEIRCYGRQIVITSHCRDTAEKWAHVLSRFSTVRGIVKALDDAKENKGTCLRPTKVTVWRTFAAIN